MASACAAGRVLVARAFALASDMAKSGECPASKDTDQMVRIKSPALIKVVAPILEPEEDGPETLKSQEGKSKLLSPSWRSTDAES